MTNPRFDVTPFLVQDEGQHFDRKSLFEGEPAKKSPRDRKSVRDEVAEYVAAFANAEGGVLILGIEDDRTVTGHAYPRDAVQAMLDVPRNRLIPPQRPGFTVTHGGKELLVFEVDTADGPVQVQGDGFPMRIGESTHQIAESKILELKLAGLVESWESRPSPLRLEDLDVELLSRARRGAGLEALTDEEYLLRRKLADMRGGRLSIRRAAELLFAAHEPDHANSGVRIFRVIGTDRRFGPEHNVEERPRIEGPLPKTLDEATKVIGGLLRRPSRLVGTKFRETPEYPEFSWKEALLNALAHRDYGVEGRAVEVWLFDDRLEVTSPGGLVPQITIADLVSRARQHVSRNPRIVRVMVDLGYMRDQGEGIPRVFAEMEGLFLPEPDLESDGREFRLVLRNTPTLTGRDRAFIALLGPEEFSDDEFRALLEAHRHGRIDNARMRAITGLDTLGASRVLRKLCDRGWLKLHPAGSQSFYEFGGLSTEGPHSPRYDTHDEPAAGHQGAGWSEPAPAEQLEHDRASDRGGLAPGASSDRGGLEPDGPPDRGGFEPEAPLDRGGLDDLPAELGQMLAGLGPRPRKERLRAAILRLTEHAPYTPAELAALLGVRDVAKLVERHLGPMVNSGQLERTHPDNLAHPRQRYRARQASLGVETGTKGRTS